MSQKITGQSSEIFLERALDRFLSEVSRHIEILATGSDRRFKFFALQFIFLNRPQNVMKESADSRFPFSGT